ncbi:unnamed protein product [Trichobilharzia regenti]|nr:unnamed protein product [Trichobilharzia regenti]
MRQPDHRVKVAAIGREYYLTHTSSEVNTDSGDSLLPGKFYDACRLTDKKSRNNNERLNGKYNKKKGRNTSKLDTTITTTNDETMISSKQIVPVNNFVSFASVFLKHFLLLLLLLLLLLFTVHFLRSERQYRGI